MRKTLLLSLFIAAIAQAQPLAGDYFINQDGSEDYNSISAAVADLNSNGISSAVTFRIRGGTYDEQININSIIRTGASDDRVIFKRAIPAANVIWKNSAASSGSNWVVQVDGAEFVTFANIRFEAANTNYQGIFSFINNTDSITVANCQLIGMVDNQSSLINSSVTLSTVSANSTGMIFTGNTFTGASMGIFIDADLSNFTIANNTFSNQYKHAIYAIGSNIANRIENNVISEIVVRLLSVTYNAILFSDAGGIVRNNNINIAGNGVKGLKVDGAGVPSVLIANNFISSVSTGTSVVGIEVTDYADIIHNTVHNNQNIDTALKIIGTAVKSINVKNNILYNSASGLAFSAKNSANTAAIEEITDNDFYNNAVGNPTFPLIIYDEISPGVGKKYDDITTFAYDVRQQHPNVGLTKSITFTNALTGDLHLSGASIGDSYLLAHPQSEVTDDIDGDARNGLNVYLGADQSTQIVAMDNADSLNGLFYTIAGASPDYSTPQEALDDLYRRGMKGEVKFKIRAGSYPTYVQLNNVVKLNATDLISIVAANPANQPVLTLAITSESVGFSNLTDAILNTDTSSYLEFKNLDFSLAGEDFAAGIKIIHSKQSTIEGCTFTDGSSGIIIYHDSSTADNQSTVRDNVINNQRSTGIEARFSASLVIENNTITSVASGSLFTNILIKNQFESTLINANTLTNTTTFYGISVSESNVSPGMSILSNNIINGVNGLTFFNTRNWTIYHNSINVSEKGVDIINTSTSDYLTFKNNIIQAATPIQIYPAATPNYSNIILDYNIYDNAGATGLIKWFNQSFDDIPAFTAATGMDAHSLEKATNFVDAAAGDLHLTGASIGDTDLAGTNVAVLTDYDGDTRSLNFPYIGADEASALSVARVQVIADGNQTFEDGSANVNLSYVLLSQPASDVLITIASSDTSEATVDTTVMTFTTSNWSTPQIKTVTAVDDAITDGTIDYAISSTVSSSDVNYDGFNLSNVALSTIDDDLNVSLIVEVISDANEPSTSGSYRIRMEKNQAFPNNIALSNANDITLSLSSASGSATNAVDFTDIGTSVVIPALSSSITLTVQPIDDTVIEGTEQVALAVTQITGGVGFISVNSNPVDLAINDDDTASVVISVQRPAVEPNTDGLFTMNLTGALSATETIVDVSFAGAASQGIDYQNMPSTVTIPAMASSVDIPILVIDDIDSEGTEEITISLDAVNNPAISIIATNPLTSSVMDDDTDADISVSLSAINATVAVGDVIDFSITLSNNSNINIHQAVLQVLEPAGLSFTDWQCDDSPSQCTVGSQTGDITDVVSIDANDQLQYSVFALVTGQISEILTIEAVLNPAPFLNDTDTSNNTDNASSLVDIYFQNSFEQIIARRLLEQLSEYSERNKNYSYAYISTQENITSFVEIDKNTKALRYRYIDINANQSSINFSEWIYAER